MVLKWIGRVLYVGIVGVIAYFLVSFSLASRNNAFLLANQEIIESDDYYLISAIVVTDSLSDSTAYVKKEPLYQQNFVSTHINEETSEEIVDYSLDIKIYSFVWFNSKQRVNCIGIIVNNIVINDANAKLDDYGVAELKCKISFTTPVVNDGASATAVNPAGYLLFDNSSRAYLIDENKLKTASGTVADFKNIDFSYTLTDDNEARLLSLANVGEVSLSDKFEPNQENRTFDFSGSDLNMIATYPQEANNDELYYNPNIKDQLEEHNIVIVRYVAIYVAIVIVITYLLFFNKLVVAKIRAKIDIKKQAKYAAEQEKKKELADGVVVQDQVAENTDTAIKEEDSKENSMKNQK